MINAQGHGWDNVKDCCKGGSYFSPVKLKMRGLSLI